MDWIELHWLVVLKETEKAFLVQPENRVGDDDLPDIWLPKSQMDKSEGNFVLHEHGFIHKEGPLDFIEFIRIKPWLFDKNPEYSSIFDGSYEG